MTTTAVVLKVTCCSQIHRVLISAQLTLEVVEDAVQRLWPDFTSGSLRFRGPDGGLQVLDRASFGAFAASAETAALSGERPVLRLELLPAWASAASAAQPAAAAAAGDGAAPRRRATAAGSGARAGKTWQEDERNLDELVRELEDTQELEETPKQASRRRRHAKPKKRRAKTIAQDEATEESVWAPAAASSELLAREQDDDQEQAEPDERPAVAPPRSALDDYDIDLDRCVLERSATCPCPPTWLAAEASDDEDAGKEPESPSTSGTSTPQLWPATPCSTPPSSPRAGGWQWPADDADDQVLWVAVPMLVQTLPVMVC